MSLYKNICNKFGNLSILGKCWFGFLATLPIYQMFNIQHWDGQQMRRGDPVAGFLSGLIIALFVGGISLAAIRFLSSRNLKILVRTLIVISILSGVISLFIFGKILTSTSRKVTYSSYLRTNFRDENISNVALQLVHKYFEDSENPIDNEILIKIRTEMEDCLKVGIATWIVDHQSELEKTVDDGNLQKLTGEIVRPCIKKLSAYN